MTWLSNLSSAVSSVASVFTGPGIGSTLLRTVINGFALNQVAKSITKKSDSVVVQPQDTGVTVTVEANTDNRIPVMYGRVTTGGLLTDVRMTNNNQTMHYVYTISERTGNLLSTGLPSAYTFHNIYWNGYRMVFQGDGITAASLEDLQGNRRNNISGLVRVWCYAGGSSLPQALAGTTPGTLPPAWAVVPEWSTSWAMTDLIFVVIEVTYNRAQSIVGVGNMTFDIENSMTQPGDCLYDYATSTKYGASIDAEDIRDQ